WRRGAARARRLGLPPHEARLHAALGACAGLPPAEALAHRTQAEAIAARCAAALPPRLFERIP
ncbi:MAG: hypothetical protein JWP49_2877, partial [Phenylobacterium sp.]|nr:hypothetical protein [Phenylobacterium sp.]